MYKVVGIDEAGKGPVIGSMFIAFAIINLNDGLKELNSYQEMLKKIGVKDSKLFAPKKRAQVYSEIQDKMDIRYAQLTPALIDTNNSRGGKLNELEIDAIVKVLEDIRPDLIMIDALTARPDKFGEDILKRLSFECKIISENKADSKYELVGAASIIAKELREKELKEINSNVVKILSQSNPSLSELQSLVGSGYPSDPKTCAFLKEYYNNEEFDFIFRKSWQTYKNVEREHRKCSEEGGIERDKRQDGGGKKGQMGRGERECPEKRELGVEEGEEQRKEFGKERQRSLGEF